MKTIKYARGADASAERKYERISTLEPDTDNAGVGSEPEDYEYLVHPIRGALFFLKCPLYKHQKPISGRLSPYHSQKGEFHAVHNTDGRCQKRNHHR